MPPKVAAMLATGTPGDRAVAVALAEQGFDIAIGTLERDRDQEFATASIANEIWAIGRENFSTVVDASDATSLAAFAAETADRLGRCDLLVVRAGGVVIAPAEELSADEWEPAIRAGLTVPFLAAHAFAPIIERDGGGLIAFLQPGEAAGSLVADVTKAGRRELAARLSAAFASRSLRVIELESDEPAALVTEAAR